MVVQEIHFFPNFFPSFLRETLINYMSERNHCIMVFGQHMLVGSQIWNELAVSCFELLVPLKGLRGDLF